MKKKTNQFQLLDDILSELRVLNDGFIRFLEKYSKEIDNEKRHENDKEESKQYESSKLMTITQFCKKHVNVSRNMFLNRTRFPGKYPKFYKEVIRTDLGRTIFVNEEKAVKYFSNDNALEK